MDKNEDQSVNIPGKVYLCQISESVSCGACCGLYNVPDLSCEALSDSLKHRTYEFAKTPREVTEILRFGQTICQTVQNGRPFPEFHHCPYVGLIAPEYSKIGCLLHPLGDGNNGVDFRGLSYYGGMACRIYFCPSYRFIPRRFKIIVRAAMDNWYEYGLIITEYNLINAFFEEIENRLATRLYLEMISPEALSAIYRLLTLKLNWPFRGIRWQVVNYFFEDQKYQPPAIDYQKLKAKPSSYHKMLYALGSNFSCTQNMHQAEDMLNIYFNDILESIF
ncbi:MAG: hypothetical protein R6U27_02335 [Desulfobacterales bacterium]